MLENIQEVLEKEVRPYLLEHYGDVEISSYEDGILYIRLLGQCSNCPSAHHTVEDVIEGRLKERFPQIQEVVLDTSVSPELYNFAKQILGKSRKKS